MFRNKYLDYARPQAPEMRPLDVNAAVLDALALIGTNAGGSAVTFETWLADGLPATRADAALIQQVVVNVILNAVQAMPNGGALTVRTECDDDTYRIVFTDGGRGMSHADLQRLFQPFRTNFPSGTVIVGDDLN